MGYQMTVKAIDGECYQLPADTVTFDLPPQAIHAGGPLLPLAFRSSRDVFYVRAERWPELSEKALHLSAQASASPAS